MDWKMIILNKRVYGRIYRLAKRLRYRADRIRGVLLVLIACSAGVGTVRAQVAVRGQGFVPFSEVPINYLSAPVSDPVARLQEKLDRNAASLNFESSHGYLTSVLDALKIPVASQTLVFSKTSFQYKKISPKTPRALYFNDDVYVGWVKDGKSLEIASFDPSQGAIFYLLDQEKVERPEFLRAELDCTQCHVAPGTRGVPGVLLRSVYTSPAGTQVTKASSYITGHESPISQRWGGWYVTGSVGRVQHLGNVLVTDRENPESVDRTFGANVRDLSKRFPVADYLSPYSDITALLVLAHQTQAHNLITQLNYRTRITLHEEAVAGRIKKGQADSLSAEARRKIETPAEELLRYLLFADEAPLTGTVEGTGGFAAEFSARGPRDSRGRSLRDFDLQTRIFRYPCSYLIYSEAFDAIPEPAKGYLYRRLREVLTCIDRSPSFDRLSDQDRKSIYEILLATKVGLPADWQRTLPAAESKSGSTER